MVDISEVLKVALDGGEMPSKAHKTDAGYDLYSREEKVIKAGKSAVFDTGVHIEMPKIHISDGMLSMKYIPVAYVKGRSGLCIKHDIVAFDGTVDDGYVGSIAVKLFNMGDEDYTVQKGDKIAQLVIGLVVPTTIQIVDELAETERGNNGFGSSGR